MLVSQNVSTKKIRREEKVEAEQSVLVTKSALTAGKFGTYVV